MVGRIFFTVVALLLTGSAEAQRATPQCDRECLIGVAEQYLAALVAKDAKRLPLATNVKFTENGQRLLPGDGFWNSVSGRGSYTLHVADPAAGQVVTFATMREAGTPVLMTLRLRVDNRRIAEIETLIARSPDFAVPGRRRSTAWGSRATPSRG